MLMPFGSLIIVCLEVLVVFIVMYAVFLVVSASRNSPNRQQREKRLQVLREFTEHGHRITVWLKRHIRELSQSPMTVLNDPEYVDLVNQDQELYEKVLRLDPDYPDTIMPPAELRQYLIEIAQGQHKQTH